LKPKLLSYPFVPKTTVKMLPGQFWALPLRNGSFGCGRVIQLMPGSRSSFLAGVLDWHGDSLPTAESIAGAKCFDQGNVHLKAITETGGCILGHRPLELDGIEPWEFRRFAFHANSSVQIGNEPVRAQRREDTHLPVLTGWGFRVPITLVEMRFL
jgi:hypothetical protein